MKKIMFSVGVCSIALAPLILVPYIGEPYVGTGHTVMVLSKMMFFVFTGVVLVKKSKSVLQ